jgi:tape measure domain-containing protein
VNRIVETIYRLRDNVSAGLDRIGLSWRRAGKDADEASQRVEANTGRMGGGFTALIATVKKFGAAILAISVVGVLVKIKDAIVDIVSTAERLDDVDKRFATAFGGVEAGTRAMSEVRAIAETTPFAFEAVANAAIEMRKRGLDPLDGSLKALLDNAAANDQSMEDLSGTIEALGKASLRGEVGMRALVSLTERGIPVFQLLSNATGKSETELRRMAASGQLGADAIKQITTELGKMRAGAAQAEFGDLDAQFQKLRDRMDQIKKSLVAGGPLELIQQQFVDLNREVAAVARSPEFGRLTESIRGSMTAGTEAVRAFVENIDLRELVSEFQVFGEAVRASIQIVRGIEVVAGPALNALDALTLPLKQMKLVAAVGLGAVADGLDAIIPKAAQAKDAIEGTLSPLAAVRDEIDAAKEVGEALALAFQATRAGFDDLSLGAAEIALKLGDIGGPADEAKAKILALMTEVREANPERIGDIALALAEVGSTSEKAGENLRAGLGEALKKLTGEQLLQFQTSASTAFSQFRATANESSNVLETTLMAALEKLKVSGAGLGQVFTPQGEQIIATFRVVAESAVASATQIEAAFLAALRNTTTTAEAEALGAALNQAADQGRIGIEAATRATVALNDQLAKLANAADPLADAFSRLGIVSQRELDRIAETARSDFDLIVQAARSGTQSLDDVGRAFVAMAQKQLDAVRNASEWERRQVEASLRTKAAALGLRDALAEVGLAGQQAGADVAGGAQEATAALDRTAAAANRTADAAEQIATTGDQVVNNFTSITYAAQDTSFALDGVSDAFIRAATAQSGFVKSQGGRGSEVAIELQRQSVELERQIQLVRDQNAEYDELEMRVRDLRGQFQYLSDDRLRQLAQEQQRLDENMKRREESLQRERELVQRQQTTSDPNPAPPPRSTGGGLGDVAKVELTIKSDPLGQPFHVPAQDLSDLAEKLTPLIVDQLHRARSLSGR